MLRSCLSCVGASGSRTLSRTFSTCPGAAATTTAPHPTVVSRAWAARPSPGQGKRSTSPRPSSRFTTCGSRGRVAFRALGQGGHPQGALGRVGQPREDEVLVVGEARGGPQLGIQHPRQQPDHRDQPQPGRPLVVGQPFGFHRLKPTDNFAAPHGTSLQPRHRQHGPGDRGRLAERARARPARSSST